MTTIFTDPRASALEAALLAAPSYNYVAMLEELDVLRDVLIRRTGTPAQRNSLLRVIKANKRNGRSVMTRLVGLISISDFGDNGTALFSEQAIPAPVAAQNDTGDEDDNT